MVQSGGNTVYSTSAGGKDLSNDAKIRVIGPNGALDMHKKGQKVE